jgi:hypothetical protein
MSNENDDANDRAFWEGDNPDNHVWHWFDYQSGYYDDYGDEVTAEQRALIEREFAHLGMASWPRKG